MYLFFPKAEYCTYFRKKLTKDFHEKYENYRCCNSTRILVHSIPPIAYRTHTIPIIKGNVFYFHIYSIWTSGDSANESIEDKLIIIILLLQSLIMSQKITFICGAHQKIDSSGYCQKYYICHLIVCIIHMYYLLL